VGDHVVEQLRKQRVCADCVGELDCLLITIGAARS
jgi:hypothetical protein